MTRCDVLIVGGGPAGSSCAWGLRDAGLDVVVLDRQSFPRDKTCAGWITPSVSEMLHLDLDDYGRSRTLQRITGFRVGLIGGTAREVRYGPTVSYGIRRCEFDDYLLRRCGAQLRLGESFQGWERRHDGWVVNQEIEARVVVGAGGHFCPVARQLGARSAPGAMVVSAQEVEFCAPAGQLEACRVDPETPELYFCPDLQGYGWCFRKGTFLNIGLGRLSAHGLPEHVATFVDDLRRREVITGPLPTRFHGHAYQLGQQILSEWIGDRVLLVGDAAGLAHPQSGEGIRPAVESGLLAARAITAAAGDYSRSRLEPYAAALRERFGLRACGTGTRWIPAALQSTLGRGLLGNRTFLRKIVLDRWFLQRHRSALV